MPKKYQKSIFLFCRDYRLDDNKGLIECLKNSEICIPIFVFTPEQITKNQYKSDNCVQFMIESLEDLNNQLKKHHSKLTYFYGQTHKIIHKLIKKYNIDVVYTNKDYTPFAKKREKYIEKVCKMSNISFELHEDYLLYPVKSILTGSKEVYTKFTPYFNNAKKTKVDDPIKNNYNNYIKRPSLEGSYKGSLDKFYTYNDNLKEYGIGGRKYGKNILKNIGKFKNYNKMRNILSYSTTKLSAYIKFGCVSIREVYHAMKDKLGMKNDLIKQLYWREFYYNIMEEYPYVIGKYGSLKEKYNKIQWNQPGTHLTKWKNGMTGYPIVDAAMQELNTTGYMHNRGRLIVSNFLIKVLGISWKHGEKYFAQTLVDYSVAVNNGNWQWSSGSGADSQQYNRVFNPYLQSEKYDPDCEYIKKWLPELKDVPSKHIHQWNKYYEEYNINYPKPIIDYDEGKKEMMKRYLKIFKK